MTTAPARDDAELCKRLRSMAKHLLGDVAFASECVHMSTAMDEAAARIESLAAQNARRHAAVISYSAERDETIQRNHRLMDELAAKDERLREAERDAARYRVAREHIDWLTSDENGVAGLAYSCQIQLSEIEQHSPQVLLDMICDGLLEDEGPAGDAAIAQGKPEVAP